MDTATFDEKDVICWQSDNSVRYVEVDRVTTVWLLTAIIAQDCLSSLYLTTYNNQSIYIFRNTLVAFMKV